MKTVIIPLPAIVWGGLQGVVAMIDGPLKSRGYQQHILIPKDGEDVRDRLLSFGVSAECVSLPRLQRSPRQSLGALAALPGAIRHLAAKSTVRDCVLMQAVGAHHPHAPLLAGRTGRPLVWQLHSDSVKGIFLKVAQRYIKHHQDGILANGRKIGQTFAGDHFGTGNHGVFYPPIQVKDFRPNPAARKATRDRLGLADEDIVIATIGNRSWQKNHQLFVKIAEKMLNDPRPLRFLIVGSEVPNYTETYRAEVLKPAERLNSERLGFIKFIHFPDGLAEPVHSIDLLCMTSHAEGIPLVVAECMAAGIPVVSSNVGAISEVVLDGETGFILSAPQVDSFVARISHLLENPDRLSQFGARALTRAECMFSPDAVAETHATIYKRAEARETRLR